MVSPLLPTAHLAVTFIIWWVAHKYFGADTLSLLFGIILGVFIDADALFLGSKHRASPLHSLFLWIIITPILYIFVPAYSWIVIFPLAHIALDSLDYEIYLAYPFSQRTVGLRLAVDPNLVPGENSIVEFAISYLKKPIFLALETLFGTTAIILLLTSI